MTWHNHFKRQRKSSVLGGGGLAIVPVFVMCTVSFCLPCLGYNVTLMSLLLCREYLTWTIITEGNLCITSVCDPKNPENSRQESISRQEYPWREYCKPRLEKIWKCSVLEQVSPGHHDLNKTWSKMVLGWKERSCFSLLPPSKTPVGYLIMGLPQGQMDFWSKKPKQTMSRISF